MAIQPVKQLFAVRGDMIHLRIMDMGVDKAGDDKAGQMVDRDARIAGCQTCIVATRDDEAVLHNEQPIWFISNGVRMTIRIA